MGSDPTRAHQCGHTGSTGRLGKNGEPPPPPNTHLFDRSETGLRTHAGPTSKLLTFSPSALWGLLPLTRAAGEAVHHGAAESTQGASCSET